MRPRLLLFLAIAVLAFIQCGTPALAAVIGCPAPEPAVTATPGPPAPATSTPGPTAPAPSLTAPCAYPDALLRAGLLTEAEGQYEALLAAQYPNPAATPVPTPTPTPTPTAAVVGCAVTGLSSVEYWRQQAVGWEAQGDQAAAAGQLPEAEQDYACALSVDRGNIAAQAGLQKADQQPPDSIRQARDFWSQVVSNTLVPMGQFFLWLLAVGAGIYLLYLLTRVSARWLPLPARPDWQPALKLGAWLSLALAVAAAGATAGIGFATSAGGWWLTLLIVAAVLAVLCCVLLAWYLRSESGVQFGVINRKGEADKAACAYLAGRLTALGTRLPRGFDLPRDTDVTSLTKAVALLPGGGVLSALAGFLLIRVPVTPWTAIVTLIDDDQLLVTLHQNGRLAKTVLASRGELFFPGPVAGQEADGPSPFVKDIDQNGMLTIAAAVILTGMAEKASPLQIGLNGAKRWQSVAGQVLATDQGFGGNQARSKALLARAVDADPGNLGAVVAQVVMHGRRARKAKERAAFAGEITRIWEHGLHAQKTGYEALQLRVLYGAAAAWSNVYLGSGKSGDLEKALHWTEQLVDRLQELTERPQKNSGSPQGLAQSMKFDAYALGAALTALGHRASGAAAPAFTLISQNWQQEPQNAHELYADACLAAASHEDDKALDCLEKAIAIDDDLRTWARYDPSFGRLAAARNERYLKAVGGDQVPRSFTAIGPLAGCAAKLTDIGVRTAADLLHLTVTAAEQERVAQAVGVSPLVVARWRDIALLATVPGHSPDPGQLNVLIAQGVDSQQALQEKVRSPRDFADLVQEISDTTENTPVKITELQLRRWAHPLMPWLW